MKRSLFLGIDVSKGYADFCLLSADKQLIGTQFQLLDLDEGYQSLFNYLKEIFMSFHPDAIYAAAESTGHYENHWLDELYSFSKELPIKVARLNPFGVLKHRQATLKEQITDKTSSRCIAEYLINYSDQIEYYKPDDLTDLRSYLIYIDLLVTQKVQLSNQLHHHLYNNFPEILPKCRNGFFDYILRLLEKYPTTSSLARAHKSSYKNIYNVTEKEWYSLRERCKRGNVRESNKLIELMIRETSKQIRALTQQIDEMFDLLYEELPKEKLEILRSIPGIGKRTALILLCTIGDVKRFKNTHQIVSYFGLYPVTKESGDGKKRPYMSQKGNSMLRKYLYMSALVACHKDPYISKLYQNLVDRGMSKKQAICKMMNKMLRMIYGMLIHNQVYNPQADTSNKKKCQQRKLSAEYSQESDEGLTERMIALAPISRKNAKYRKEQTHTFARTRGSNRIIAAPSSHFQE